MSNNSESETDAIDPGAFGPELAEMNNRKNITAALYIQSPLFIRLNAK